MFGGVFLFFPCKQFFQMVPKKYSYCLKFHTTLHVSIFLKDPCLLVGCQNSTYGMHLNTVNSLIKAQGAQARKWLNRGQFQLPEAFYRMNENRTIFG